MDSDSEISFLPSSYTFTIKPKSWVDAQDTDGVWRLGRVKEIFEDGSVLVSFDGWSDRYDQAFCEHSPNIAPLRFYTKGYTGQQRVTLREYELQPQLMKLIEQKMTLLRRTEFKAFIAYEITAFLRGELFVFIDDLLTRTYLDPKEELKCFTVFFMSFLELYKLWAVLAPSLLEQRDQAYAKEQADPQYLYLEDKIVAVFESGYELCLSFGSLFNSDERAEGFFKNYGTYVKLHELANEFMGNGGLTAVTNALKAFSIDSGEYVPIEMLWPAIVGVMEMTTMVTTSSHKSNLIAFSEALLKRLLSITQSEANRLSKDQYRLNKFLRSFKPLLLLGLNKTEAQKMFEKVHGKLIAQRPLSHTFSFSTRQPLVRTPKKTEVESENAIEKLKTDLEECKEKLKDMLEKKRLDKSRTKLKKTVIPHMICDKQEPIILATVKELLAKGKETETKKLVQWRKQILELAEYSGWEMAEFVSDLTQNKLSIEASDIINAGLSMCSKIGQKAEEAFPKTQRPRANTMNEFEFKPRKNRGKAWDA